MTPATCIKFSLIFLLIFGNPFLYGIISYYAIVNQPSTLGALSKMPGYVPYSTGPAQGLAGGLGAAFFTISLIFAVCLCDEISSGRFANFLCFFSIPNHLPMPILFAAAVYGIVFWNRKLHNRPHHIPEHINLRSHPSLRQIQFWLGRSVPRSSI